MQELQRGDPQQVGPYRLVGRLGSGGMGRVFLGRSAGGRLVAVKVIRDELAADPDFRMRFGREVAAAKQVGGLFTALLVALWHQQPMAQLGHRGALYSAACSRGILHRQYLAQVTGISGGCR